MTYDTRTIKPEDSTVIMISKATLERLRYTVRDNSTDDGAIHELLNHYEESTSALRYDELIKYLSVDEAQNIINTDEKRKKSNRGDFEYYYPVIVYNKAKSDLLKKILIDRMNDVTEGESAQQKRDTDESAVRLNV